MQVLEDFGHLHTVENSWHGDRNAIYALKKGAFQPGLLATYYTFNQGGPLRDSKGWNHLGGEGLEHNNCLTWAPKSTLSGCTFQDLTFRTPDESRIDANVNYEAQQPAVAFAK